MVKVRARQILSFLVKFSILIPSVFGFILNVILFKYLKNEEYVYYSKFQLISLFSTYVISNSCFDSKISIRKSIESNFRKIYLLNLIKNSFWFIIIVISFLFSLLFGLGRDYIYFFSFLVLLDFLQPKAVILLANQKRFYYIIYNLLYNICVNFLILFFILSKNNFENYKFILILIILLFYVPYLIKFCKSKYTFSYVFNYNNFKYSLFKIYNNSFELTLQSLFLNFLPDSSKPISLFLLKQTSVFTIISNALVSNRYKLALIMNIKEYFVKHIKFVSTVFLILFIPIIFFVLFLTSAYEIKTVIFLSLLFLFMRFFLALQQIEFRLIEIGIIKPILDYKKIAVLFILVFVSVVSKFKFSFDLSSFTVFTLSFIFTFIYILPTFINFYFKDN